MASLLLRWNIERTEQSQSSETVSQAGSFSNDSYGLSSYSFSAQGSDTVTQSSSDTYAWLLTGTDAGQETVSGPLEINGSGTFSETLTGGDSSGDTQTDSWSLTEGGSVSAGQLALSCYALSEEVSSSANSSASNSMTENDAGYAGTYVSMSVTHTFTYTTGGANHSASSDQSSTSSASLEEQGVYSNGSFDLSLVSYTGSGSATGSASDGDSGSWSGTSFSSSATDSAQSADSGSYSVSASGYYSNGSFSLSSYDLQGTSTDTWAQQATETDVEQLPGSGFHGSPTSTQTFSRSDTESSLETDTVYQTGAMTAGSYTNLSYSNVEDSVTSVTEHSLNTGYSTSDTWQTSAIETLGLSSGTAAGSSAYSFTEGSASGSGTNSVSSTLTWTAPGAVVNCMAPDASSVGFVSADASGGGAGVSTPELGVVDAAGEWLSGTNASAQEATEPESATPMVPPGAARGPLGDPPDQPGDKASKDRQNLLLGRQSTISCHAPQNNQPSSFDLSALKTPSKDPLKDLDKLIITTKKSPPKDFSRVTRNGIPSLSRRPPTLGKESPDQEYLTGKDVKILSTFASGHLGTGLYVIGSLMDLAEGGGEGGGEGDEFFHPGPGPGPGPRQATPKLPMQNGKPYGTPAPKHAVTRAVGEGAPIGKASIELPSEASVQKVVDETVARIKVPSSVHPDVIYSHALPQAAESGGLVPHVAGQLSSGGGILLDAAVVDPALIGASELAKIPLAARVEAILAHEVAEASIVKAAGGVASAETHLAAIKAAQFTTLEISAEARAYLKAWSDASLKAGKGLPPP